MRNAWEAVAALGQAACCFCLGGGGHEAGGQECSNAIQQRTCIALA